MTISSSSPGAVEIQRATPQLHPSLPNKASEEAKLTKSEEFVIFFQNVRAH